MGAADDPSTGTSAATAGNQLSLEGPSEINQCLLEGPSEINQCLPEGPSSGPAEPAAEEEAVRPEEVERLDQIRDLAYQEWWVGPLDEGKIEKLWGSFDDRLPRVASENMFLWRYCLNVGADLDDLPQVTNLQGQFVEDVRRVTSGYLSHNHQVVIDEMQRLGLPTEESTPLPPLTTFQTEQIQELQIAAASLAKLQLAQAEALLTDVGYEPSVPMMSPSGAVPTVFVPVKFDPYAPPPSPTAPDFWLSTPNRKKIVPYEDIKKKYDKVSDVIASLLVRYPALSAFIGERAGALPATTAGFASTQDPRQALEHLAGALRQVLQAIEGSEDKLESGGLDPLISLRSTDSCSPVGPATAASDGAKRCPGGRPTKRSRTITSIGR